MAVDLGTAYISLVPTTKDFDKGIKSALDASVKHADKAGQQMGDKLTSSLSQHFDKGGAKVGDAFGKSFTPKVQGAGKTAMQGLAQSMLGGAEGIGSQVGGRFSGGLVSAISRGADGAMAALGKLGSSGGWSSGLVTAGMVAAGGVALIGTAAFKVGQELYDLGEVWDGVADGITFKTGLIGEQLDAVKESVKNVASDTAASIGDIANVAAALTKGLKIPPGSGLEKLTQQISEYNAAAMENGAEPINMREFIKAMKQMKLDGNVEGMMTMLDDLYKVTQNTTIPMNSLIENLKTLGPVAAQLKVPATTLVQIIAGMEESGLNAETAMLGLRTAWKKLQDDPNPANGFRTKLEEITTLLQSTSEEAQIAGAKMATEFFGNRAGPALAEAIKNGNLELSNFNTTASKTGLSILEMKDNTSDFAQQWTIFTNFLKTELEPVATRVFSVMNDQMTFWTKQMRTQIEGLKQMMDALFGNPYMGGNPGAEPGMAPGPEASAGILGGAAGINPGIGANGAVGGNAASSILGGMAGTSGGNVSGNGLPSGVGGGGRGYQNYGKTSAYIDQQAGSVERWRPAVKAALSAYGAQYGITNPSAWESAMMRQIATESGGNPTVWNNWDSNAKAGTPSRGLLQFIPGTFAQHNITGGDIMDPNAQIAAFIPYVMSRYGVDQNGAPLQVGRGVGYDTGGWLPPGGTLVQNDTGKPELVLNPDQQKQLADAGMDPNAILKGAASLSGVDPNTIMHGTGGGAAPGPDVQNPTSPDAPPDYAGDFFRSLGFTPTAAGSTGVAGTSSLASFIKMPAQALGGLYMTAAQLGSMAVSAAIAAGAAASGGPAAAGAAASPALSYGFTLAAQEGKIISDYWLGSLPAIGADALIAQLFPFGAPRWLGYDYTNFAPQLGIGQAATTTLEKMGSDAINKYFGLDQNGQPIPGATPGQMGGAAPPMSGQAAPQMMNGNLPGPAPGAPAGPPPAPVEPAPPPPEVSMPMAPSGAAAGAPPPPSLIPNLFGYDDGGMLPPGGFGVNMTNRPEPVLTPQQWEAMNKVEPGSRQAPLVKIDAIYGMSPEDVANQIEAKQKLAMMRYAGRP